MFPYDAATGLLNQEIQVASSLPKGFSGKSWAADIHVTPDGQVPLRIRADLDYAGGVSRRSGERHASASCGKVDPVFRTERCAARGREHRLIPDGEAAARLRNRSFEPIPSVGRSALEQHDELFDRPGKRKAHRARSISHGQEPQLGCVRRPVLSCVDRGPPVLSQTQTGAESWNQTSLGLQVASRSHCSQSDGRGLQAYLACPLRITRSALLDVAGVAPTPSCETLVCRVSGASFPDALTRRACRPIQDPFQVRGSDLQPRRDPCAAQPS
jgi:hypothetical protein